MALCFYTIIAPAEHAHLSTRVGQSIGRLFIGYGIVHNTTKVTLCLTRCAWLRGLNLQPWYDISTDTKQAIICDRPDTNNAGTYRRGVLHHLHADRRPNVCISTVTVSLTCVQCTGFLACCASYFALSAWRDSARTLALHHSNILCVYFYNFRRRLRNSSSLS